MSFDSIKGRTHKSVRLFCNGEQNSCIWHSDVLYLISSDFGAKEGSFLPGSIKNIVTIF